jgi:enoyl-CoA hydratase/carnithine racemase
MEDSTMNAQTTNLAQEAPAVISEIRGAVACITLNRPKALNALSLPMIRALTDCLLRWRDDPAVQAVAIRGSNKAGPFGAFCAGGDIRFFHQAALAGDATLEDFFTEEYALNHLIHSYPKPYLAFMDGIVMGGGMGISQGASHRLVTTQTKMAMPETNIGLFPDVGGGYFLSRCPGSAGEWLALTGEMIGAGDAIALGLADHCLDVATQQQAWDALASADFSKSSCMDDWIATYSIAKPPVSVWARGQIDHYFSANSVGEIVRLLEASSDAWAQHTAASLRQRSPLMLHVALAQIRRAREMSLADDLRLERDLVRHCFHPRHLGRSAAQSETVEGVRALAIDKDHAPKWLPQRIEEVTAEMVAPFFDSPWTPQAHPLRELR